MFSGRGIDEVDAVSKLISSPKKLAAPDKRRFILQQRSGRCTPLFAQILYQYRKFTFAVRCAAIMLLVVNMVLVNVYLSHPENLECGTDATTRLDLGARIMQGAVSRVNGVAAVSLTADVDVYLMKEE